MPRYDKPLTNKEVRERIGALLTQVERIQTELGWLQTMQEITAQHEQFVPGQVQDRITTLSLAAKNFQIEVDTLWKLTRR